MPGYQPNGRSMHGETRKTDYNQLDVIRDYNRLKILYDDILTEITTSMNLYKNADFELFHENLPNTLNVVSTPLNDDNTFYYNSNSLLDILYLNTNKSGHDSELVSNYRDFTSNILDVLKQGKTEYEKIINLTSENQELLTFKELVEDRSKLIEYLNDVQSTSYLFSSKATFSYNIDIKPWYERYLQYYGPPGDGVFTDASLADIIEELKEENIISDDTIIY